MELEKIDSLTGKESKTDGKNKDEAFSKNDIENLPHRTENASEEKVGKTQSNGAMDKSSKKKYLETVFDYDDKSRPILIKKAQKEKFGEQKEICVLSYPDGFQKEYFEAINNNPKLFTVETNQRYSFQFSKKKTSKPIIQMNLK